MKKKILFVIIPVTLLLGYFAWSYFTRRLGDQRVLFAPARPQHFTAGNLTYTVYRAEDGVNDAIVYHLHGRNLDPSIWNDDTYYTAQVQAYWQNRSIKPPTVVVVSYGPVWLLTPRNSREESGLLDDFIARLPEIESNVGSPRERILLGESMGGLNVLIAGLRYPEKFAKIASLCPGVYLDSPFADYSTQQAALERTGADPKIIFGVRQLAQRYIASEEDWNSISPIKLIEKADKSFPDLYLSCGLYDNYGNFEGTEALAKLATEKGVSTEWRPLYGGHCVVDIASLAEFLASN